MNDIQPYQFEPEGTLQDQGDSKCTRNELSRETLIRVSLESAHVTSEDFSFLLAFESGFRYSRNGIMESKFGLFPYIYNIRYISRVLLCNFWLLF